jgi:hypothetical protein
MKNFNRQKYKHKDIALFHIYLSLQVGTWWPYLIIHTLFRQFGDVQIMGA